MKIAIHFDGCCLRAVQRQYSLGKFCSLEASTHLAALPYQDGTNMSALTSPFSKAMVAAGVSHSH